VVGTACQRCVELDRDGEHRGDHRAGWTATDGARTSFGLPCRLSVIAIHVLGLATALPSTIVDGTTVGMTRADQEATGFYRVHVASDAAETPALLAAAARDALAAAKTTVDEVDAVIVMRNGVYAAHASAWLSLLVAEQLGVASAVFLDIKCPGCAGLVLGLQVASALITGGGVKRALVVGGGASGLRERWFPDPPVPGRPPSGILSGDGAYALVVAAAPGRFEVLSWKILHDPAFANLFRFENDTIVQDDDEFARWLTLAPSQSARAMLEAMRAAGTLGRPHVLIGSNSRIKAETFTRLAGATAEPRIHNMLELQFQDMADVGHVLGGDACRNLAVLERDGELAVGDTIAILEIGDAYFYSFGVLSVAR